MFEMLLHLPSHDKMTIIVDYFLEINMKRKDNIVDWFNAYIDNVIQSKTHII